MKINTYYFDRNEILSDAAREIESKPRSNYLLIEDYNKSEKSTLKDSSNCSNFTKLSRFSQITRLNNNPMKSRSLPFTVKVLDHDFSIDNIEDDYLYSKTTKPENDSGDKYTVPKNQNPGHFDLSYKPNTRNFVSRNQLSKQIEPRGLPMFEDFDYIKEYQTWDTSDFDSQSSSLVLERNLASCQNETLHNVYAKMKRLKTKISSSKNVGGNK